MFLFVGEAAQSTPIMGLLFSTNHNSLQVCSGTPKVRFMQKAHVDFWHYGTRNNMKVSLIPSLSFLFPVRILAIVAVCALRKRM